MTGFFEDSKKNIWILTSNTTYDIVEDNKGLIWVATASSLVTYSYESNTFSPVNQELASGAISSPEKDLYGKIWYGEGGNDKDCGSCDTIPESEFLVVHILKVRQYFLYFCLKP